jgi:hypothetical protein
MISSQEKKIIWMLDFVGHQEAKAFQGSFTSIDVITQKEIILIGGIANQLKEGQ